MNDKENAIANIARKREFPVYDVFARHRPKNARETLGDKTCLHLKLATLPVFRSRDDLVLENLALRQQQLSTPNGPATRLGALDKLFWVLLRRV